MNTPAIYLSHPTGNQNSRQLAQAFAASNMLLEFSTAMAVPPQLANSGALPARLRDELARRSFPSVAGRMRSLAIGQELSRLVRARLRLPVDRSAVDSLYRAVDQRTAHRIHAVKPTHVYCYEDGAFDAFQAAKAIGAKTIYELPIGHWRSHRALCDAERELQPDWAHTWNLQAEPDDKLQRKDGELAAAGLIVVPSGFVKDTLLKAGIRADKIAVVPYGCPAPAASIRQRSAAGERLRVLFVGGLSQRKGLSYLVKATAPLSEHIEVTVIGSGAARPMLPTHWRLIDSLPHANVLEEMRRHDVFVFPTLFEGRSLAVAEAVASGLILITTPNSGAADLVEQDMNGWTTGIRDADAITQHLETLLSRPQDWDAMKMHALNVAKRNGWDRYAAQMNALIAHGKQHA